MTAPTLESRSRSGLHAAWLLLLSERHLQRLPRRRACKRGLTGFHPFALFVQPHGVLHRDRIRLKAPLEALLQNLQFGVQVPSVVIGAELIFRGCIIV